MIDLYAKLLTLTKDPNELKTLMSLLSEQPRKRSEVDPYRPGMRGNIQALKTPPERRVNAP